jgi:hypothetical protein
MPPIFFSFALLLEKIARSIVTSLALVSHDDTGTPPCGYTTKHFIGSLMAKASRLW